MQSDPTLSDESGALLSEASVERLALRLAEAHLLMDEGRHEASLVESRKLGELVANALLERSERAQRGGEPLGQLSLQRSAYLLERRGSLPPPVAAALIALQPLGNVGAHDQGDDAAYISSASAQAACSSCVAIITWLWREERYAIATLREPAQLSETRRAQWAPRFRTELSPLLSDQTRSLSVLGVSYTGWVGLSLALILASAALALSLSKKNQSKQPLAPTEHASAAQAAEPPLTQVKLRIKPERSLFELGDSAELSLIDSQGVTQPIERISLSGAQFKLSGARMRAVSSGRAELEVCAEGALCVRRSLMVLLP